MPEKPSERRPERDELPPLPELDDDGSTHEGDDDGSLVDTDESVGLDDAAIGDDAQFTETFQGGEHGLLDEAEGHDALEVGVEVGGLGEHGLLEGSDEGDGRDVTSDEAGVLEDSDGTIDDGGSEGTDEDPADAIADDRNLPPLHVDPSISEDREGVDDVSVLEDRGAARLREGLERSPWPPRSDVAWEVEAVALPPRGASIPPPPFPTTSPPFPLREDDQWAASGKLVAVARFGTPLMISIDAGAHFVPVPNCSSATAVAIVPTRELGPQVVVALHDVVRDVAGLAVVRVGAHLETGLDAAPVAELVAELPSAGREPADGDDPDAVDAIDEEENERARVEKLFVGASGKRVEVLATGAGFAFRLRG